MQKRIVALLVCGGLAIDQQVHTDPPRAAGEEPFIVVAAPLAPGITLTPSTWDDYALVTSSENSEETLGAPASTMPANARIKRARTRARPAPGSKRDKLARKAGKRLTFGNTQTQSGGRVMSDPRPKDKVEDENQRDIKSTPEYRKFRKLLKRVVKAPPMRRTTPTGKPRSGNR